MYISISPPPHTHTHTHTTHMHTTHAHSHTHTHTHTHTHAHTHNTHAHIHTHTRTHAHMYTHTHTHHTNRSWVSRHAHVIVCQFPVQSCVSQLKGCTWKENGHLKNKTQEIALHSDHKCHLPYMYCSDLLTTNKHSKKIFFNVTKTWPHEKRQIFFLQQYTTKLLQVVKFKPPS